MSLNPTSIIAYSRLKRLQLKRKARTGGLAYFALFLTSFVWGTTWVASKIGIQGIHPLFFSSIRQMIGGSCFLLFFLIIGKAVWPTRQQWGQMLVLAFFLFVTSNGLTTWGIKYIHSGLGAILGATFPLMVAIIEWAIGHHRKPGPLAMAGLLLGFAGVAIIFYEHLNDLMDPEFRFGILLSLTAAVTWAIGTVITARSTPTINRYYALGWQMFLAGAILFLISLASGLTMPVNEIPAHTWKALAYMVVLGSVITFGALLYSLQHLPTAVASLYAYFNPMVAVVAGHFILNEPWSLVLLMGALVTVAGVYLVNHAYRQPGDTANDEAAEEEEEADGTAR
ncbi:MAG TPA: EamA family transporter [Phnomibacter sp.]|nr:EamA family transporter [Phnomibacter sp.]